MNTDTVAETICYTADVVLRAAGGAGHVLLIKRRWDPYAGRWALPGGHVDVHKGETSLAAAVRELKEETGVAVPAGDLWQVGAYDALGRDPRGRYVTVAYTATLPSPVPPAAADDAVDARWWPLNALPALAFDHGEILASAVSQWSATARTSRTDTFAALSDCFRTDLAALVSEEAPQALTASGFIDLVERARDALSSASVGYLQEAAEDLDAAVSRLTDALTSSEDEQSALLARARIRLRDAIEATR
ncbi:NUDIX domain-containing protein [Streptomyces monomycini]|uniref:NUDIX domain-containing protein n=1 Tax=Streptomyces monomycini TaxID=371720 RepID=UPI0009979590|nr:NUDIX hydrolase [Streptomyces monomycini]